MPNISKSSKKADNVTFLPPISPRGQAELEAHLKAFAPKAQPAGTGSIAAATPNRLASLALSQIAPGRGLRVHDAAFVEGLAASITVLGLKQPIEVMDGDDGVYQCVGGFARLEAVRSLGWEKVPAVVVPHRSASPGAEAVLHQAFGNLLTRKLDALERMEHLFVAKKAHDEVFPNASKRGPKATREASAGNSDKMSEIPFSDAAAETIGISPRHIRRAIGIWEALAPRSRARLRGSVLADKQSELKALSELPPDTQALALDLILKTHNGVDTVEEALVRLGAVAAPDLYARKIEQLKLAFGTLDPNAQRAVFDANEEAVKAYAIVKGWVS